MGGYVIYIFIGVMLLMLGGMWIFNNRRYKKQQQEREDKMNSLSVGDKIVTIGMIVGEIVEKNEDGTFVLKTGSEENAGYITIRDAAIYQIIKKEADAPVFEDADLPAVDAADSAEASEDTSATETEDTDQTY